MGRPKKERLSDREYHSVILRTKKALRIHYNLISSWMNISESNLRAMIYLKLNPTDKEWNLFKTGLKNYLDYINEITPIAFFIPRQKTGICKCGCKATFIKWSWNKIFYNDVHRKKYWKKNRKKKSPKKMLSDFCDSDSTV